jgi:hypothetical protein
MVILVIKDKGALFSPFSPILSLLIHCPLGQPCPPFSSAWFQVVRYSAGIPGSPSERADHCRLLWCGCQDLHKAQAPSTTVLYVSLGAVLAPAAPVLWFSWVFFQYFFPVDLVITVHWRKGKAWRLGLVHGLQEWLGLPRPCYDITQRSRVTCWLSGPGPLLELALLSWWRTETGSVPWLAGVPVRILTPPA